MGTYDKALDKGFWKRVREDAAYAGHRAELQAHWNAHCTAPIPELSYSLFKLYYVNGDRRTY